MDLNEEKLELIKRILSVSDTRIIEQLKNVFAMNEKKPDTHDNIFSPGGGKGDELSSGNSIHYAEFMQKYKDIIKKK